MTSALIDRMRGLCRRADLILPNATEAALLLEREPQTDTFDDASAQALADELLTLAPARWSPASHWASTSAAQAPAASASSSKTAHQSQLPRHG